MGEASRQLPTKLGNEELQEECDRLRAENDSLRQRLEDESHQRLRGEIRELQEKLQAKNQKMISQREEASKEIKNLTEQRDKFQRWTEQMGREIKELRESLPDDEVRSLPDPGTLLNTIKRQNPKSKTSLRDVEAILEAIGD